MIFQWGTPMYSRPDTAAFCDTKNGRLLVRRSAPRARTFLASLNGVHLKGAWDTLQAAQSAAAKWYIEKYGHDN